MITREQETKARNLLKALNFDQCLDLFEKLPAGNPLIDYVFERMEEVDKARFEIWMD